jgi:hypothetical protein
MNAIKRHVRCLTRTFHAERQQAIRNSVLLRTYADDRLLMDELWQDELWSIMQAIQGTVCNKGGNMDLARFICDKYYPLYVTAVHSNAMSYVLSDYNTSPSTCSVHECVHQPSMFTNFTECLIHKRKEASECEALLT